LRTFNTVYDVAVTVGERNDLGAAEAFRAAYARHRRGVYAAAFRILGDAAQAQDVVQDVFVRLWRRPASFDASRGELGSFLRLMARSRALDLWREGQVRGRAAERLRVVAAPAERSGDDPGALTERESESAAVRDALRKLPEAQREALVLAYWGGLTADQIARRTQIPIGTAKSRIRLGLARLRDEFTVAA
jgi:RNA polymerase sigma-70 factor (ECF subfamily)